MILVVAADYHNVGACGIADAYLRWAFALEPRASEGRVAYVQCLVHDKQWKAARDEALTAFRVVRPSDVRRLRQLLVSVDSALGRPLPRRDTSIDQRIAIR